MPRVPVFISTPPSRAAMISGWSRRMDPPVRDSMYRHDPNYMYRFTLRPAEPDFTATVIGTDETLFRGRENVVTVRVRSLEGWNTPVEVWAENLPLGVPPSRWWRNRRTLPTGTPAERSIGWTARTWRFSSQWMGPRPAPSRKFVFARAVSWKDAPWSMRPRPAIGGRSAST